MPKAREPGKPADRIKPEMEVGWLEDFICLEAARNFTRAAELRHMTQPAFSRRIQSLEAWLGTPLIDRSISPIALTESGASFIEVAREIVEELEKGKARIRDDLLMAQDLVVFAASHSLSTSFFPSWLRSIEQRLGVIRHRLISDKVSACLAAFTEGRCHFVLCHTHTYFWPDFDRAHHLRVGRDRLIAVCGKDAGGQPLFRLPATATQRVPFLGYELSSSIGQAVESRRSQDAALRGLEPVFTSPYASVLASMARQGRGIAWLPESLVELELTTGALLRAANNEFEIDVDISLFRSTARLSKRSEAVWRHVTKTSA